MKLKKWQLFQKKSLGPNFACKRFHGIPTNLPMFSITELKNPLLALLFTYCFICKPSLVLRHAKHCARILKTKVDWDRRNHISEQMYKRELLKSGSRTLTETRIASWYRRRSYIYRLYFSRVKNFYFSRVKTCKIIWCGNLPIFLLV